MSIIVYWLDEGPQAQLYLDEEMSLALKKTEELRRAGKQHVSISSQLENSVGKPGVDDVSSDYDWKKRRG